MFEDIVYNVGKTVNDMISAIYSAVPQSTTQRYVAPQSVVGNVVINRETATRQTVAPGYAAAMNGQVSGARYGLEFN